MWDWSAKSGGTVLLDVNDELTSNILTTGGDDLIYTWLVVNDTECLQIPGAVWDGAHCNTSYLKNAMGRIGDFIGIDNDFCDSNEACLYALNIGAYQGYGSYGSAGDFVDGEIIGVSLKQNANNGR